LLYPSDGLARIAAGNIDGTNERIIVGASEVNFVVAALLFLYQKLV